MNTTVRRGIFIHASNSGEHSNFTVRNNIVQRVNGSFMEKDNGGIIFLVEGTNKPSWFTDILIENNEVKDISGVGIRLKSQKEWESSPQDPRGSTSGVERHAFKNVVVRGNRVSNITKNAIIVASSDAPLVEYNVMGPKISTQYTGNSLFVFATDNALVQYNEAFGNTGPKSDADRGGFDADYKCRNTIFQYNYTHDNNFAFGLMRKYHDGVKIRYNVSVNDKVGFIYYGFPTDTGLEKTEVTHNTFYSSSPNMQMFVSHGKTRKPLNTTFRDDIFVFTAGGATWGQRPAQSDGNIFESNIVVGLMGHSGPMMDPRLSQPPAMAPTGINFLDPTRLSGFQLCTMACPGVFCKMAIAACSSR